MPTTEQIPPGVYPTPATKTKPAGYRVQKFVKDQFGETRKISKTFRGPDALAKASAFVARVDEAKRPDIGSTATFIKFEEPAGAKRAETAAQNAADLWQALNDLAASGDKTAARLIQRQAEAQIDEAVAVIAGEDSNAVTTLTEFVEGTFFDGRNGEQKRATWAVVQRYGTESGCMIQDLPLSEIKSSMINNFVFWAEKATSKNGRPYAKSSIDRYQKILRSMITKWAVDEREFNPAAPEHLTIKPAKIKGTKAKQKVRTQDELQAFEAAMQERIGESEQYKPVRSLVWHYHRVLRHTGQRLSEIARIRREDLSDDMGTVFIRDTKTGNDRRIPLLPDAKAAISEWLELRASLGFADTDIVFAHTDGKQLTKETLRGHYRAASDEAKLSERVTPHQLRHSFNDMARKLGVPKEVRKAMSGHVTDEMAENYTDPKAAEILAYFDGEE